jgi:large subunit ribosomal protein L23
MEKNKYNLGKILGFIKYPLLTEKSFKLFEKEQYTFLVDKNLKKDEMKYAFEKIFNVKIIAINTLILPPKYQRVGKYLGKKSLYKKVMIKLKKGDIIPDIFD